MPTLRLRLTPDQVKRLRQRAEARGVDIETYLAALAARDLSTEEWNHTADEVAALLAKRPRQEPPPERDAFYADRSQ